MQIFNCHAHIFTNKIVPENFLPLFLKPLAHLIQRRYSAAFIVKFLSKLGRKDLAQLVKKYHAFTNIGNISSQLEVLKHAQGFYPAGTKFCVLSMDMEYMKAGRVPISFEDQLNELAQIKQHPE